MSKRLAALSLLLCGAAATAFFVSTASAQAPSPRAPMMLAQNTPPSAPRTDNARGFNRPAPTAAEQTARRAEFCQGAYARAAGRFAELEVRLNLTGAQTGAFNRWRDLRLAAAKRMAGECTARPMGGPGRGPRGGTTNATPPSPVERLTREETRLQHRLADIQTERPALEALYTSLNTAQRQTLVRERGFGARERGGLGHRGMGPRGGMRGNMVFRRGGMDGPMNGGMRRGPGGPGDQPPPPPPGQFPQ